MKVTWTEKTVELLDDKLKSTVLKQPPEASASRKISPCLSPFLYSEID